MSDDIDPALVRLVKQYAFEHEINVMKPTMPRIEDYIQQLSDIWESHWLTNNGPKHQALEEQLKNYLGVEFLNLLCNGTIALMVALQALRITIGQVITTPFTFPATTHSLYWNGATPVFCDIDPDTLNLNPDEIEMHIGPETRAILAVHVFGVPCDVERIEEIAKRHNLAVIYDAAHAFGVKHDDRSILQWGDMSILSFHATKLYSTIEGGCIVSQDNSMSNRIEWLKNFGIVDEETVIGAGINGKLNEFQAAYGLLQLDSIDLEIAKREVIYQHYFNNLSDVPGISFQKRAASDKLNYAYCPILIDEQTFGISRDQLYTNLKMFNVNTRKYFYPLISEYPCYKNLPSATDGKLLNAKKVERQVLCLPIYGDLSVDDVTIICNIIKQLCSV